MVIASQALTALIPLLLLVSTLAPATRRDVVSQALVRRFELIGNAADAVRQVFAQPAGASCIGVLSVVILVFSGVSLAPAGCSGCTRMPGGSKRWRVSVAR
jgi:hypothetical protein